MTESNSCNRVCVLQGLKYWLSGPLEKTCWPLTEGQMASEWQRWNIKLGFSGSKMHNHSGNISSLFWAYCTLQTVRAMFKHPNSASKIIDILQIGELSSETWSHLPKATEPALYNSVLLLLWCPRLNPTLLHNRTEIPKFNVFMLPKKKTKT